MRITFGDWRVGSELGEYFRRCDCSVELVGTHELHVEPRLPLLPEAARLEIEGLLRVWRKLHPDANVDLLPSKQTDSSSSRGLLAP